MFKLLLNYIRDQKNNWLQVIGLGFLVIIMIASFLSLTFGANYVADDYKNNIANGELHQEIQFPSQWNPSFKRRNIGDSWLENINYVTRIRGSETDQINETKMLNATFQLQKLEENFYRFYFEEQSSNVHVGAKFAKTTNHNFLDFKLSLPFNYPSVEEHDAYLQQQATIIDRFVFDPNKIGDPNNDANKTNFFITNTTSALDYYNNSIKPKTLFAKREYNPDDVGALAKLYYFLTIGMLWGDNISWDRSLITTDLLVSSKTFAFVQTSPNDKVNAPILVNGNNAMFDPKVLADNEILVYQEFAKLNNLTIDQDYYFSGYKFTIVGFATSAFSANNNYYFRGVSDNKNQTVAFINQNTMNKVISDPFAKTFENRFMVFNPEQSAKQISDKINNEWIYQYFHNKLINNPNINKTNLFGITNGIDSRLLFNPLAINFGYHTFEHWTWATLQKLTALFTDIASVFLVLIFIVASVIIFIVVFKMIDRNKKLIGILKANGYQNWKISVALVSAIVFPIIIFALIAVALSVIISHFIVVAYASTMIIVNHGFPFYWLSSLLVVIIPILVLFIISSGLVTLLLQVDALSLIHNSWGKEKYNFKINAFLKGLTTKLIKNFSFKNKLAITTTFRSFGKVILVSIVSIFASTLMLFSLSATGLVGNMLGLQFASIDYHFNSQYKFTGQVYNNFLTSEKQLLYKKEEAKDILARPSLYEPLKEAINEVIKNPDQSKMFDFRYGYIKGSELYQVRKLIIEPNFDRLPEEFKNFWNENIHWIDYLTNNNGQNETVDLILNFGLLPYDKQEENPYTQISLWDPHDFNINTINTDEYYFDNKHQVFVGDWSKFNGVTRVVQGVNQDSSKFLNPSLRNSNLRTFSNLTLSKMTIAGGWLNNSFLQIRESIIEQFKIENPESSSVKIIPMVGSVVGGTKTNPGGDGGHLGKTVLYRYNSFDGREKYIIGVIYDGARNLLPNNVLMPNQWLNEALFDNDQNLISQFANSKFTNFPNNELWYYLPIISEKNDYNIDLSKVIKEGYLTQEKAIGPGLGLLYDVNSVKDILLAQQYTFQTLILLFAIFSVFLSFLIVIIISNINIRDNLILINILRSLGYSSPEVSYIFLIVMIPLIVVFSLFSVLIAPILTNFLAGSLANVIAQQLPVVFLWWYYAIPIFVIVLIYFISFVITWKLNINDRQLMNLTK
ncbi:MAG: ABC transporter permease [Spiroplasma sp.]|nr:ABC transporter permease [Spiroplasma sp.]